MAHPRDRLRPGEEIILDTRPHWWFFARPLALVLGSVFMGILALVMNANVDEGSTESDNDDLFSSLDRVDSINIEQSDREPLDIDVGPSFEFEGLGSLPSLMQIITGATIILSLIILGVTIVSWYFTHFFVSSDRIVNRSGILNRQGVEIPIERINTVFFEQNFIERLIGAGDVLVESAGESGVQRFYDIANPLAVQERLQQQIEHATQRRADQLVGGARQAASSEQDMLSSRLVELNNLRRQGILTVSEFESKKREILERY